MHAGRMYTGGAQVGDLVVHQRNQRRHHHRYPFAHQRRNLIAERFAAAGGHQHGEAAAAGKRIDDVGLSPAKIGIAEHIVQNTPCIVALLGHLKNSVIMGWLF